MRQIIPRKRQLSGMLPLTLLLPLLLLPAVSFAADNHGAAPSTSAYVYVGSSLNQNPNINYGGYITGFAVAADGSAQPIAGSPFSGPSLGLATAQSYVFGDDGQNIASYAIASDGALREISSVNDLAYIPDPGDQIIYQLNPDRAGQTLNTVVSCNSCNSEIAPWAIASDGHLSYIGGISLPGGPAKWGGLITYAPNDNYAYTPTWGDFGTLQRNSNGTLTWISNSQPSIPSTGNVQNQVCIVNDVASSGQGYVTLSWFGSEYWCSNSGLLLATYTVGSGGTLQMVAGSPIQPQVQENGMAFDPTGTYLAIAGAPASYPPNTAAIQIFKLQADGTMTPVGAALDLPNTVAFQYVRWDNAGHVYALTQACYQGCSNDVSGLFISNFNGQSLMAAPGSPYAISNVTGLAVVPQS